MGTAYDKKDASRETGVNRDHVGGAWHNARNDSAKEGRLKGRNERKESANADVNYYTGRRWNKATREWE